MTPQDRIAGFSAAELNRLHDEARQRAASLRDEAIAQFWRSAHAAVGAWVAGARRAAARLQQHRQLRGT